MKTNMRNFRVRWDGPEGERVVSAVAYSREGAEERKQLLVAASWGNVEVFECKPGSDEEI